MADSERECPEQIERCRDHYGEYYLLMNPGYGYVRYQQELICPVLEQFEQGDFDRMMLLMEPGHAKTRLCTAGFAPWLLGRRPDREIIILSYGHEPASQFGQIVRDAIGVPKNIDEQRNNHADLHRAVFPWCQIRRDVRARRYFETTMGGKIHATSWKGAIASTRADFVLIDDPHKNYDDANSAIKTDDVMSIFNSVVKDRLKPNGKILICTNRWAPRDLPGRVMLAEGVIAA